MDIHVTPEKIKFLSPDALKPNPKNRNKHPEDQIKRLMKLIEYQGFRQPIIVSTRSGFVVAGHGRLEAAKKLALKEVPVLYQDFASDEQEYAFGVSDNAVAAWADLDLSGINMDLSSLGPDFDLDTLGIKNFVIDVAEKGGLTDPDSVPTNVDTRVKLGDVWRLGEHRLMCGDSTSIDAVERLMNGEKADMVFTDPPYGISFKSKNVGGWGKDTSGRQIQGDESTNVAREAWQVIASLGCPAIIWGGNYFTDFLPVNGKWLVWNKLAFDKPNQNFSHCELAWTNLPGDQVEMISHVWDGAFRAGSKKEELGSRVHPNQKPVGMIGKILEGTSVLDLFGGSGSTLIACEKTNRRCFMMELDPHYCSVILKRWEDFTGNRAELQAPQA